MGDDSSFVRFSEDMKNENTEDRIRGMRRAADVARALGPAQTMARLLPAMQEHVEDDDEVLLTMAEQLGSFVDLVGGEDCIVILLDPLSKLAEVEETVVREKAVESASVIIKRLSSAKVAEEVVPMIMKLSSGDWFTARVSACGLFAPAYERLEDAGSKAQLRMQYTQLCHDDTPMVKRAASKNFGDFAKVLEKENLTAELMGPFNDLAKDEQDSVRLLAIENCTVLAAVLPEEEKMKQLLPLVEACAMDKSWRVRNNVAQEFYELSKAMHVTNAHPEYPQYGRLLGLYVKLLQDPEGEVRASAAKSVHGYLTLVGQEAFLTHILPVARDLGADPMPNVRTALAESLMKVSKDSMKPEAIAQHIVPTVQSLLNCDMPEVRLKVLESFGNIAENMNGDQLQATFLTTLISLATNPQWRVRENIVNQLPLLAHKLGTDVFESRLLDVFLTLLQDQVNAVRMAATQSLRSLAKYLGTAWIRARLLPRLNARLVDRAASTYLQRITVLYAVRDVVTAPACADISDAFLPLLLTSFEDDVPNVQFVAVQAAAAALDAGTLTRAQIAEVHAALLKMGNTSKLDVDVRYFTEIALSKCA